MEVRFREVDPFNCWIWLRYSGVPSKGEKDYIDGIFDSWYVLGRLGGFNSENLQTHEMGKGTFRLYTSYFIYGRICKNERKK